MESHRWKWVQITSIPSYFINRTEKSWSLQSILIIIRNVTAWGGLGVPMDRTPEQRQSLQGFPVVQQTHPSLFSILLPSFVESS